ncbi:peptide chain release factor H [uncultured Erythrobacter sp.]|uniref:peptide chain release factor H n=1 Tax=uncultured Erythrobacter sp. TaxID=263913 RepID=UPI002632605E|nr:peptide chain release factor H [uncultured Erythrobacter sp.]
MNSAILHISSGQGPKECRWCVERLGEAFGKEAAAMGLACSVLEVTDDCASMLLKVEGPDVETFVSERTGTVRWIGTSPFRPNHKRKNWFVGVRQAPDPSDIAGFDERDITYQAIRASGPGGQHVNKTDSAIRAVHGPSGLTCVSQEQRSQFANKKTARLKIALMLEEQQEAEAGKANAQLWEQNLQVERGNAVRVYQGPKFKLKR